MSNLCKTQLCATVTGHVNDTTSASCVVDILFNSVSTDRIEPTNRSSTVSNLDNLPDANTVPNGHVAYIDEISVPVIASNGTWIGFDGRTLGTFFERQLWSWGDNQCGRLGHGTITNRCSPVREFCSATDWCQVSADVSSSAIKTSGQLWAWGLNTCGQLGDGTTVARCSPVREFCSATDWCQVDSGGVSRSAIKITGELWSWGWNSYGRLGDGTTVDKCSPVREFCSATDWCQVAVSGCHNIAIKTTGELWGWGLNTCGRIGDGTTVNSCSPVREICSATNWCQVSAGFFHTAAIKTSGELWTWGSGACGRLGDGTTVDRCSPIREICSATNWCQVSGGRYHTAAVKTSGQIWSWGRNECGHLGDGTTVTRCSPVRERCSATDWCQVNSKSGHTAAIKTSGQLWSWGVNFGGQLGIGNISISCSPVRERCSFTDWCQVSAGFCHTLAIRSAEFICR